MLVGADILVVDQLEVAVEEVGDPGCSAAPLAINAEEAESHRLQHPAGVRPPVRHLPCLSFPLPWLILHATPHVIGQQ